MKRPWQVWVLFSLCMLVALAAMAWLTVQTLHVDRERQQARAEAGLEQKIGLVLWRMDTKLAPIIAEEVARPGEFYRTMLAVGEPNGPAFNQQQTAQVARPQLPTLGSNVRLNFSCAPNGVWKSPQVPVSESSDKTIELRRTQLKQLAKDVSISELIAQLPRQPLPSVEQAAQNSMENPYVYGNYVEGLPTKSKAKGKKQSAKIYNKDLQERNRRFQDVAQQEFGKQRGDYRQQRPSAPPVDAMVSVENVSRPVWAGDNLLLARRVDRGQQTEVQGSWLDWPRLKALLLEEAVDLLPQADLAAVVDVDSANPARMLAGLPVELIVAPVVVAVSVSAPTRWALSIGWGALLVASASIGLLLRGVLALSERRAAFVSAVTHELRTPLTTFRMYSEMLAKDMVPDAGRRREYLETLQQESQRLTHLVENVLSYARLERGRGLNHREQVTASQVIERFQSRLVERAKQADMELEVTFGGEAAREALLTTDVGVVEQILFNLVDNAAKYAAAAEDRRIHLEIDRAGDVLRFTVRDHGPGFDASAPARRWFTPFGKSAEEAAVTAPGVGLGLALCRRLASQLGGSLQVGNSAEPGAVVTLRLPVD